MDINDLPPRRPLSPGMYRVARASSVASMFLSGIAALLFIGVLLVVVFVVLAVVF